jgi:hypothetical protein
MGILALSMLVVLVACAAGIGALIGIIADSARTSTSAPTPGAELNPVPTAAA